MYVNDVNNVKHNQSIWTLLTHYHQRNTNNECFHVLFTGSIYSRSVLCISNVFVYCTCLCVFMSSRMREFHLNTNAKIAATFSAAAANKRNDIWKNCTTYCTCRSNVWREIFSMNTSVLSHHMWRFMSVQHIHCKLLIHGQLYNGWVGWKLDMHVGFVEVGTL